MEQKVIQVGNSLAVTLPSQFVKGKNLKAGQNVFVDANPDMDLIQISTEKKFASGLTPEFKSWVESFNKKYKNALQELAKK